MSSSPPPPEAHEGSVAAIDLGSNSFHMVVGRLEGSQLRIVDTLRERVRLGDGLEPGGPLDPDAGERALGCLMRFEERVRGLEPGRVRVVGTQALRQAKDGDRFIREAEQILGRPIEIIAGREEARLIHLGVIETTAHSDAPRVIMDIGGGSTELILCRDRELLDADSYPMGCVSFSQRFFPGGKISPKRFRRAEQAAKVELESSLARYTSQRWEAALGCSGTLHSLRKVGRSNGWGGEELTPETLEQIKEKLIEDGHVDDFEIDGLADHRRPVIAGGLAIAISAFELLGIDTLTPTDGALREGVLFDLVGRIQHDDVRDHTLAWMTRRYAVDLDQAARVERTAHRILEQVTEAWGIDPERGRRLLSWASSLHEVGLSIAHVGYHKHSAYIVTHSDMAGFSMEDQHEVASLLRAMRRKFKRSYFEDLLPNRSEELLRLSVVFRLARTLHRSRRDETLPPIELRAATESGGERLRLTVPASWLQEHDLMTANLEQLAEVLETADIDFEAKGAVA